MEAGHTDAIRQTLKKTGMLLGRTGQIIFMERFITFLTRFTDVAMIFLIWKFGARGALYSFLGVGMAYFIFCTAIVYFNEFMFRKGYDVTGIETLRGMAGEQYEKGQWFKRAVGWVLRSRKTIFWIGSWFYLDPDYVTILLYERERGFVYNILRLTLPAIIISMTVWTAVYYSAYLGFHWAVSVLNIF